MAFSPRSKTTFGLPLRRESPSELTYDLKSFVRQAPYNERDKPPSTAQQRLWLDITHLDTSQLQQIDNNYNSNMWKNFKFVRPKHSANFGTRNSLPSTEGMIADMYPLSVPKPSRIGKNTYHKFLHEIKLPEPKQKIIGWQQQGRQELQSRSLKVQSECRAPPTDWEGNILPPSNFKRYQRPESILPPPEDYLQSFPSYNSPSPKKMHSIPSSSLYSRQGTPWHYGLRVRRPHVK